MERLIVFALVYLLPTQLAYHFWLKSSYIYGIRVDYLSSAIYLTDILIVLLLPYIKKGFRLLFPVVFFALINIFFAQLPLVTLLKWLVIFKLIILGLYFYYCDLRKLKNTVVFALSLSLITVFLIGLIQFLLQRTIGGFFYFLGERSFTYLTPGISLMNLLGKNLMRAYAIFSHPNSFAGFVVVSFLIILSFYFEKAKSLFMKPFFLFIVVILSLLLTLSLNAILGIGFVIMLFFLLNKYPKIIKKMKAFIPVVLISFSLLFGAVSSILPKDALFKEAYKERVVLAGKAIEVFSKKPVLGAGLNNFFFAAKTTQPAHNIYLIILCETGIVGTLIFYLLLTKLFTRKLNRYLFLAVIFVLITGFFDHYWFTLQQNQLILSLLLGLSLRKYNI